MLILFHIQQSWKEFPPPWEIKHLVKMQQMYFMQYIRIMLQTELCKCPCVNVFTEQIEPLSNFMKYCVSNGCLSVFVYVCMLVCACVKVREQEMWRKWAARSQNNRNSGHSVLLDISTSSVQQHIYSKQICVMQCWCVNCTKTNVWQIQSSAMIWSSAGCLAAQWSNLLFPGHYKCHSSSLKSM